MWQRAEETERSEVFPCSERVCFMTRDPEEAGTVCDWCRRIQYCCVSCAGERAPSLSSCWLAGRRKGENVSFLAKERGEPVVGCAAFPFSLLTSCGLQLCVCGDKPHPPYRFQVLPQHVACVVDLNPSLSGRAFSTTFCWEKASL